MLQPEAIPGQAAAPESHEQPVTIERKNGMFLAPLGDATVLDNYLILKVKEENFAANPRKLAAVRREVAQYEPAVDDLMREHPELEALSKELMGIHHQLWYIEDRKRAIERGEDPDSMIERLESPRNAEMLREYLTLARQVSLFNDIRAQIKKRMNEITGSAIVEVKSHATVG